jgi:hypothetical protein
MKRIHVLLSVAIVSMLLAASAAPFILNGAENGPKTDMGGGARRSH